MSIQLQELDSVRVVHVSTQPQDHLLWESSVRSPQVGDVGTVIEILPKRLHTPRYVIECVGANGRTLWMATFGQDDLELIARP